MLQYVEMNIDPKNFKLVKPFCRLITYLILGPETESNRIKLLILIFILKQTVVAKLN